MYRTFFTDISENKLDIFLSYPNKILMYPGIKITNPNLNFLYTNIFLKYTGVDYNTIWVQRKYIGVCKNILV